jgi:hypothetical protein
MPNVECPNCAAAVPAQSRFCLQCGSPHEEEAPGARSDYWRYWPRDALLVLAGVFGATGIVLLGAQVWLWAILALVLAGVVLLVRWEEGRRHAGGALGGAWSRLSTHRELVSARSRGQIELFRLRRELAELQAERSRGYHELGRATHAGDEPAAAGARAQLDGVSERIAGKEVEIGALIEQMEERVRRVQAQAAPTQRLEAPPEPARVPEPYPPPDEGTPPEPARIPEPFPEPVPERAPDDPPPEPETPPAPQTKRRRASRAQKS